MTTPLDTALDEIDDHAKDITSQLNKAILALADLQHIKDVGMGFEAEDFHEIGRLIREARALAKQIDGDLVPAVRGAVLPKAAE